MIATVREQPPDHERALQISSMLRARCHRLRQEMRPGEGIVYEVHDIIRLLNKGNIRFVLMGTHAIVGWRSEVRATNDVDLLIAKKDHAKAVRIIRRAYPKLKLVDVPEVVTRFVEPTIKDAVIDLMKPGSELYRAVFRYSHQVGRSHRIPDLEMALVCKFAAMTSVTRAGKKKLLDAGDFTDIVEFNREMLDIPKLKRLAEKVRPGGGQQIAQFIDEIDAGRTIQV